MKKKYDVGILGVWFGCCLLYTSPLFFVEAMIAARRFYGVDKPAYCYRYGHTEIKWNRQKVCDLLKGISDNLQISSKYGLKKLHNLTIRRLNDEYRQLLGDSIFSVSYTHLFQA